MIGPSTIIVQIEQFCNCVGHINEVKKALDDVKILSMDPENGKFTILTTHHPEAIKYALKNAFPKKNIILYQQIDNSYSQPLSVPNVNDIGTALVTMSQAEGLESVEYTQSSTFKLNFSNNRRRHNQPTLHDLRASNGVHLEDAPQVNIRPSAPYVVDGYPASGFYVYNKKPPHGCCTIV